MTASLAERTFARKYWRQFAEAVLAAAADPTRDASHLRREGLACSRWVLPTADERGEGQTCWALGPMARAFAYQPTFARRAALAPHLFAWATTVLEILDRSEPPPASPSRPFRADIDG